MSKNAARAWTSLIPDEQDLPSKRILLFGGNYDFRSLLSEFSFEPLIPVHLSGSSAGNSSHVFYRDPDSADEVEAGGGYFGEYFGISVSPHEVEIELFGASEEFEEEIEVSMELLRFLVDIEEIMFRWAVYGFPAGLGEKSELARGNSDNLRAMLNAV